MLKNMQKFMLIIFAVFYFPLNSAQEVPTNNNGNTVLELSPLPFPNVTFCETTELNLNASSFEFRWTLTGLQNYYETVRKFYDSVYFTKNITKVNGGAEIFVTIRVGISIKSLTATVQVSPIEQQASDRASFEGQLYVNARHGNASYTSSRVTTHDKKVMEFKWYLAQTEREEIGRLLEIYTDAVVTNPPRGSLVLPTRERQKQSVTLMFKIIRYGISPVLETNGGGGLQRCGKDDYN